MPAPTLIYFGGNAEEVSCTLADPRWPRAWSIVALNYRGYGASEGAPGERALTADALAIYDAVAARDGIDRNRIVAFGRSLGTAIAARVAAERPVAGVVLVSPYDSLAAIGSHHYPWLPVSLLLRHRFDALADAAQQPHRCSRSWPKRTRSFRSSDRARCTTPGRDRRPGRSCRARTTTRSARPPTSGTGSRGFWRSSPGDRNDHPLSVEIRVVAEDALLVERQAALGGQIGGDPRAGGDPRVQRHHLRMSLRGSRHRLRERVVQASHDLEQRQVGVGEPGTDEVAGPLGLLASTRSK